MIGSALQSEKWQLADWHELRLIPFRVNSGCTDKMPRAQKAGGLFFHRRNIKSLACIHFFDSCRDKVTIFVAVVH